MPPKPKFTREEVVEVALTLVSERGMAALTARELGERLGSSARPIFTAFRNMEELTDAVREAAMRRYDAYVGEAEHDTPIFKAYGVRMVLFATEKPKLFQLLFMSGLRDEEGLSAVAEHLGPTRDLCIAAIVRDYSLTPTEAKQFFEHMWVYTYGLSTLCATGMCHFDEETINVMLGREFMGMLSLMKHGNWDMPTPRVNLKS
ncbi:MAG TPA: TetR/AcrR family transcriptional regulator [Clostridiales bacterium]|nr:TetR/AcrR family transcriptional regulator [Clostridiales bacterium]